MSTFRFVAFAFPLAFTALTACSAAPDTGEETSEAEQAARRDPCALVRCAAGTHCVAKGRRASCVADAPSNACSTDADCRLYDNYCDGCACEALSTTSPDPTCGGTTVACFVQPCMGKTAACVNGACAVADASTTGVACGSTTCPSGQVCCNSSCGICTPPGGMCIQLACAPTN